MYHPFTDLIPRSKLRNLPSKTHQLRTMTDSAYRLAGLTDPEIRRIRAAFRLAADALEEPEETMRRSHDIANYLIQEMPHLLTAPQEFFVVVALDSKSHPIGAPIVSTIGTLRNCLVHPRETFREAIVRSANSIVTAHNHPSGDIMPSDIDVSVWERLTEVGEIIGIPAVDHLILTRRGWYSHTDSKWANSAVHFFG